jgi:hypothetical protein
VAKKSQLPDEVQKLLPLTPAVFFVLFALANGEKHGYAIMQEMEALSEGKFHMDPGTLYTTLQRLLDLELIEEIEKAEASGLEGRRRYYQWAAYAVIADRTWVRTPPAAERASV